MILASTGLIAQPRWTQLPSPTLRSLHKASFIDSLNGWVVGDTGTILKTSTGGLRWNVQDSKISSDIIDVFMLNSQRAWALSKVWTNPNEWFGTILLTTSDGGTTWTHQSIDSIFLNTIMFLDSLHGWMGGEGGKVYGTTDGGAHWLRPDVAPSPAANMPIHRIKFFTPSIGYAVGGVSEMYGVAWKTLDSGRSWTTVKVAENLFDVAMMDSLTIIAVGGGFDDGAGLAQSSDGGDTWSYRYLKLYGRAIILSFRSASEAWSMLEGQTACMFSADSGNTWSGTTIMKGVSFYDAQFPDDRHGFAVGTLGTIMSYNSPLLITLSDRWNIVSVSMLVADSRKTTLFPTATSGAYAFTANGYEQADTLAVNLGYWMKFSGYQAVAVPGTPIQLESVSVRSGWNLIGSISYPVPVADITAAGANVVSPFYVYDKAYVPADTVYPGKGYWVKVDSAGKLVLSIGSDSNKIIRGIR